MRHTDCDTILPVLVSRISLRNWKLITLGIAQIARAPPLVSNGEQTSNCFGLQCQTGWNWKLSKQSSFLGRNTICHHFLEERGSLCACCTQLWESVTTKVPSWLKVVHRHSQKSPPGDHRACAGSILRNISAAAVVKEALLHLQNLPEWRQRVCWKHWRRLGSVMQLQV